MKARVLPFDPNEFRDNSLKKARRVQIEHFFGEGGKLDPLKPIAEFDSTRPPSIGERFNPYQVEKAFGKYLRIRRSVERSRAISASAKLLYGILEFEYRYGLRKIFPTKLGQRIGVSRWQAFHLITELAVAGLLELDEAHYFYFLDKYGVKFDPKKKNEKSSFIPQSLIQRKGLRPISRLVYGHLVQLAGRIGVASPSAEQIAKGLGSKTRRISQALWELESKKFIFVVRNRDGWTGVRNPRVAENGGGTNAYIFLWHSDFYE